MGINFTITVGASYPGILTNATPNGFVIAPDGRYLFQKRGADGLFPYRGLDQWKIMKQRMLFALETMPKVKIYTPEFTSLKKESQQAYAGKDLAALATELFDQQSDEAQKIVAAIKVYFDFRLERVLSDATLRPSALLPGLKGMQREFSGSPWSEEITREMQKIEEGKTIQADIELEQALGATKAARRFLETDPAYGEGRNENSIKRYKKIFIQSRKRMIGTFTKLQSLHDDSRESPLRKSVAVFLPLAKKTMQDAVAVETE